MSVQATTWVWTHSKAQDNTLLVALAIADAANAQGAESCQSVRTICRMTRASETTVHRAIKWLLENGEMRCTGTNPRYGGTKIYLFPALWPHGTPIPGGADMAGGATSDTGGVPPEPEGGAVGGTQPQKDTPQEHPTASADADGGAPEVTPTPELFADWWQHYPKKVDKKKAGEAFAKALKRADYPTIRAGLVAYVVALRADGKVTVAKAKREHDQPDAFEVRMVDGAKILNPTTWLNGDRWEDQYETAAAPSQRPANGNGEGPGWMHRQADHG